jgi:hypothetical protein
MAEGTGTDPVDYGRGDYDVTLDTQDRAKNNPSSLTGYTIDIRPDSGWPGTGGAAGEVRFDPEGMQAVADKLDALHALVANVPQALPPQTIRFGPGSWHEANDLEAASRMVTRAINEYSSDLIKNIQLAKAAIAASAARNREAEHAAGTGVRDAGAGLGGNA